MEFLATVRFLTPAEGGRISAPSSGYKGQVDLGPFQTTCYFVACRSGRIDFALGQSCEVVLRPMFPLQTEGLFKIGSSYAVCEGAKKVGQVTIIAKYQIIG